MSRILREIKWKEYWRDQLDKSYEIYKYYKRMHKAIKNRYGYHCHKFWGVDNNE